MGQYFLPANLTKREFISPHILGDGLKALEQSMHTTFGGVTSALHALLVNTHEKRGGGDWHDGREYVPPAEWRNPDGTFNHGTYTDAGFAALAREVLGRWAGDAIVIAGDYAAPGDIKHEFPIEYVYALCHDAEYIESYLDGDEDDEHRPLRQQYEQHGPFTDVAPLVRGYFAAAYGIEYSGSGWVNRREPDAHPVR